MTAPGRYAASDGSFAKSAGSAAARGGVLIAIAVLIGVALLAWGFDGGDADAAPGAGGDDTSDDTSDDDTTTTEPGDDTSDDTGDDTTTTEPGDDNGDNGDTTTTQPVVLDPPSSIKVAVLNGTDVTGLAGERGATLGALGYVQLAGNAAGRPTITDSKVYFVSGFGDEAGVIAAELSGPASVLELAPDDPGILEDGTNAEAATADIIVVLGTDNALN